MIETISQTDLLERLRRPIVPGTRADTLVQERQLHVFQSAGASEEVEALEDESDLLAAHSRELIARELSDVAPI